MGFGKGWRPWLPGSRGNAPEAPLQGPAFYRLLAENVPAAILCFRISDRRFLEVTQGAIELYGYSAAEFKEMTLGDIRLPERRDEPLATAAGPHALLEVESVHVKKGGESFPVLVRSRRSTLDGDAVAICIVSDLSESKRSRETLHRYHLLAQSTHDIILFVRAETLQLFDVNDAALKAYGYTRAEFQGLTLSDIVSPERNNSVQLIDPDRMSEHRVFESLHVRKDGTTFPVSVSRQPAYLDGAPCTIAVIKDLTQERRERERLAYYRALAESAGDPMWFTSGTSFSEVNAAACRTYGYTREEFLQLTIDDIRAPSLPGPNPTRRPDGALVEAAAFESVHRTKAGEELPVFVNFRTQMVDGKPIGISVVKDLREEKIRERLQQRYRLLVEHAQDMIIFFRTRDLRIIEANEAACLGYGYAREEFERLTLTDLRTPDQDRLIIRELLEKDPSGERVEFEAINVRKDGTRFPVWVRVDVIDDGGEQLAVCVLRDMTERKRLEQDLETALGSALAAADHKTRFIATMSHEIRTPMNAIVGVVELLPGSEPDEQPQLLQHLEFAARSLLALVKDLLDLSKIESGEVSFSTEPLRVDDVVSSAFAAVEAEVKAKGLTLTASIDPALSWRLRGDPVRLRQIIVNLLVNAIKSTDAGGIAVEVSLASLIDGVCRLRFAVRDTGTGIPAEFLGRIFEPFVRVGDAQQRSRGSGLGLAICAQLVKLMKGEIGVESEVGRGSTFWFTAELAVEGRGAAIGLPAAGSGTAAEPAHRLPVLVAEDNEINQQIIALQLSELGYEATIVGDGLAAVEAVAQKAYGVVLMDWQMPRLDGVAATQQIRAGVRPKTPIVAMTANLVERSEILENGFDGALPKPVTLDALRATCERWIDGVPALLSGGER